MIRILGQWTHIIKSNFSQTVNKSTNHPRMSMGYLEPLVNSFHAMFTWSRDHGRLFVSEQNDHKISKYLSRDWREESGRSITIYPSFPMSPYNERKYYQTSKDHRNRNFPVTKRSTPLLLQNLSAFSPYPSWHVIHPLSGCGLNLPVDSTCILQGSRKELGRWFFVGSCSLMKVCVLIFNLMHKLNDSAINEWRGSF